MDLTSNFDKNINTLSKALRVGKSFDIIERSIIIGDKKATMYYIDGFVKDDVMELIMSDFFFIRLRVFFSFFSSKNDITTSVFDTFPIDIISKVSLGSLILLFLKQN